MKWWEKILYPERIVAVYKTKEKGQVWGPDNIIVKERHWVKVK